MITGAKGLHLYNAVHFESRVSCSEVGGSRMDHCGALRSKAQSDTWLHKHTQYVHVFVWCSHTHSYMDNFGVKLK